MGSTTRDRSLDGLRGLAALSVFVYHVWSHQLGDTSRPDSDGLWSVIGSEMNLGLLLFFVLSGYLLYRGFVRHLREDRRPDLRRYLKRRAARILPAYYVAIAGSIVLLWGSNIPGLNLPPAGDLPLFALFAQNYSPDTHQTLDPPTWTLCVEVGFYVLLPLLVVGLLRLHAGPGYQALMIGGLAAVGLLWDLGTYLGGADLIWQKMLPAWLPYFAAGMAVALWYEYRPGQVRLGPGVTALGVLAGAALVVGNAAFKAQEINTPAAHFIGDYPSGIGFALLIAMALVGAGPATVWMRIRGLAGLGIVSYGFYLWHLPLILFLRGVHPEGGFLATLALSAPLALLLAWLSWRLVEQPALRRAA